MCASCMLSYGCLCVGVCVPLCVRFGLSTEAGFEPQLLLNCNIVQNRSNNWAFSPLILLRLRCLNKSFQHASVCSIDKLWKRDANYGFAEQENGQSRGRKMRVVVWQWKHRCIIVFLFNDCELTLVNKICIIILLKMTVFMFLSPQRTNFLYSHTFAINYIYFLPRNYSTSLVLPSFCHATPSYSS